MAVTRGDDCARIAGAGERSSGGHRDTHVSDRASWWWDIGPPGADGDRPGTMMAGSAPRGGEGVTGMRETRSQSQSQRLGFRPE